MTGEQCGRCKENQREFVSILLGCVLTVHLAADANAAAAAGATADTNYQRAEAFQARINRGLAGPKVANSQAPSHPLAKVVETNAQCHGPGGSVMIGSSAPLLTTEGFLQAKQMARAAATSHGADSASRQFHIFIEAKFVGKKPKSGTNALCGHISVRNESDVLDGAFIPRFSEYFLTIFQTFSVKYSWCGTRSGSNKIHTSSSCQLSCSSLSESHLI